MAVIVSVQRHVPKQKYMKDHDHFERLGFGFNLTKRDSDLVQYRKRSKIK
jgi:hypothetical protein